LLRNPFKDDEGVPQLPAADPLRSVYCYLNTANDILKNVVASLQSEMDTACLEVLVVKESAQDQPLRILEPRKSVTIPNLALTFAEKRLEQDFFTTLFKGAALAQSSYRAEGKSQTVTLEVGDRDSSKSEEEVLDENMPTTIGEIVKNHLLLKDSRFIRKRGSVGGWINPRFWMRDELNRKVDYSSKAYYEFKNRCDKFLEQLDNYLAVELDNDQDNQYCVGAIKLINPNGGETDVKKMYYKVHSFKNAVHSDYNCLNEFELEITYALDSLGVAWVRNPSRIGYGIPLVYFDNSSTTFFPDFIVWYDSECFFIEAKGPHLLEGAKTNKLTKLPQEMHLCLLTGTDGAYKFIGKGSTSKIHESDSYSSITELLEDFLHMNDAEK